MILAVFFYLFLQLIQMNPIFSHTIKQATGAKDFASVETIQTLWSGYGHIKRYTLLDAAIDSVVVKHVSFPQSNKHPRGWNTNLGHQRKVKSYEVETVWYKQYNHLCNNYCKTPHCLGVHSIDNEILIILEDLNKSGYDGRQYSVSLKQMEWCLHWLAHFHATFMGLKTEGLWKKGTYWHLDTRPDELEVLNDTELKQAAHTIDQILTNCEYQTLVHGDAKLANFCFSKQNTVAAVDFQYVGKGCGMKDVAYFIGSCLSEDECERYEEKLLHYYFRELRSALQQKNSHVNVQELEACWRTMFPVAWADFHRFLKGWSPGHWKINSYSEKITRSVIQQIQKGILTA